MGWHRVVIFTLCLTEGGFCMNEIKRDLSDAPSAPTKAAIKEWLIAKGAKGIISTAAVALIVGVSKRVVKDAERSGELPTIDARTYHIDAVAAWLLKHPRYVAQGTGKYQITEDTYNHAMAILKKDYQTLIALWNNDVNDLAQEVCYRLARTVVTSECSEDLLIRRVANNIWHSKDVQQRTMTVSLDALRGGQA